MNKDAAVELMNFWYSKNYIKWEVVMNFLLKREFSVLCPKCFTNKEDGGMHIRYLRVLNTGGFDFCMKRMVEYEFRKQPFNLYYTLAKYKNGLPDFGSKLWWRNTNGLVDDWKENHWKQIESYDCLIDVDAATKDHDPESMQFAKDSTLAIIEFLDELKIPYYLRFSGCGYHVIIPYEVFLTVKHHFNPNDDVENSIYTLFNDITRALYEQFSELVDTGLHDSRRLLKIPYTIAFYESGAYVCWSFCNKAEFLLRDYKDFRLGVDCHFLGETKIFKRGQVLFNAESLHQQKPVKDLLIALKLKEWVKKLV